MLHRHRGQISVDTIFVANHEKGQPFPNDRIAAEWVVSAESDADALFPPPDRSAFVSALVRHKDQREKVRDSESARHIEGGTSLGHIADGAIDNATPNVIFTTFKAR